MAYQQCYLRVMLFLGMSAMLSAQVTPIQNSDPTPSLADRAATAKSEKKPEVSFPSPGVSYPTVPDGLTKAVSEFTVVVGVPRAKQTVIQDATSISTWYSIEIQEVIADHSCKMCSLLTLDSLPKTLQPTNLL